MFEALSWAQLRLHSKACGLLNVEGYFDSLVSFLDNAVEQGFISSEHRDLAIVDRDPDRLLTTLLRLS
jgi:predicted Rossmann-fold nucleotide-binding protein